MKWPRLTVLLVVWVVLLLLNLGLQVSIDRDLKRTQLNELQLNNALQQRGCYEEASYL